MDLVDVKERANSLKKTLIDLGLDIYQKYYKNEIEEILNDEFPFLIEQYTTYLNEIESKIEGIKKFTFRFKTDSLFKECIMSCNLQEYLDHKGYKTIINGSKFGNHPGFKIKISEEMLLKNLNEFFREIIETTYNGIVIGMTFEINKGWPIIYTFDENEDWINCTVHCPKKINLYK